MTRKTLTLYISLIGLITFFSGIIEFRKFGFTSSLIGKLFSIITCISIVISLNRSIKISVYLLGINIITEIILRLYLNIFELQISFIISIVLFIYLINRYVNKTWGG